MPYPRHAMITFEHVTKRYADGTMAVDDLSLECASGRVTVFVGTSGSGKTTSMRMINRMVDPTSGRILLDGKDIAQVDPVALRRGMGYVIQQAGLFPHRTVVDNIATVPTLLGVRRRQARLAALELMERVGLSASLAGRYPFQLSGGQQQRVGVARALAADPPVLLMDEPFSAVDPVVRAELQNELLRLQADLAKTIVFVTHDIDEAIRVGDAIAVLRIGGQLVQFDTPEQLLAAPADDFVTAFLGVDRGIRRLSFLSTSGLSLRTDALVDRGSAAGAARRVAAEADLRWLLVTDAGRPVGWWPTDRLPLDGPVDASVLVALGHPFVVGQDSLRAALDAAVLSPSGSAVGVDTDGMALGVASQAAIGAAISAGHDPRVADRPVPAP